MPKISKYLVSSNPSDKVLYAVILLLFTTGMWRSDFGDFLPLPTLCQHCYWWSQGTWAGLQHTEDVWVMCELPHFEGSPLDLHLLLFGATNTMVVPQLLSTVNWININQDQINKSTIPELWIKGIFCYLSYMLTTTLEKQSYKKVIIYRKRLACLKNSSVSLSNMLFQMATVSTLVLGFLLP